MSHDETMLVQRIANGTVVDHIPAGKALTVLRLLENPQFKGLRVALVMNVSSSKMGKKDLVKVEDVELSDEQMQKLVLIAPQATINFIRSYKVDRKKRAAPPSVLMNVLRCSTPTCISTKTREPIVSTFYLKSKQPLIYSCRYCNRELSEPEINAQLGQ
jgi:aspartate carbamoyltransferase regulatory subunit